METDGVFARPSITGAIASGTSPAEGHQAPAQVQVSATVANDDTAAHQLTVYDPSDTEPLPHPLTTTV